MKRKSRGALTMLSSLVHWSVLISGCGEPVTIQPPASIELPPPPSEPLAPRIVALRIDPDSSTVETGQQRALQVRAVLSDSTRVALREVSWGSEGGDITADGVFTGSDPGPVQITATSGAFRAAGVIIVVPALGPPRPAQPADDFVNSIGVNTHLGYFDTPYGWGWDQFIKPRLVELGIRHLRDAGTVVNDDEWMRIVYGRMGELARSGIRFNLVMYPAVGSSDYARLDHFGRLMSYADGVVESFEGLNEHDLSGRPAWVSEIRTFQQALYATVRGDSRTISLPVYGPTFGRPALAPQVGDLSAWLDWGNLHPYPGGQVPLTNFSFHVEGLSPLSGNRPWLVTETGYHNALLSGSDHRPVPEEAAARYLPRLLLEYFARGIPRTYLYEFVNLGGDLSEQEQNFGLLRQDGSPKPAYFAIRNLIRVLEDPGPPFFPAGLFVHLGGDTTGVRSQLLAKRDGRHYLVLWQEVPSYSQSSGALLEPGSRRVTVQLRHRARLRLFAPLESSQPVLDAGLTFVLPVDVPDRPVIVEISP